MEKETLQNIYENEIKKGQFTKAMWQSVKVVNGITYTKVSKGVVRFVSYGNIKGVIVAGKVNVNETCLIPNTLYYNSNTQTYYVQLARTETKPMVKYLANGVEITKDEYEIAVKPRHNPNPSPVFRVKLENLLSLGND